MHHGVLQPCAPPITGQHKAENGRGVGFSVAQVETFWEALPNPNLVLAPPVIVSCRQATVVSEQQQWTAVV